MSGAQTPGIKPVACIFVHLMWFRLRYVQYKNLNMFVTNPTDVVARNLKLLLSHFKQSRKVADYIHRNGNLPHIDDLGPYIDIARRGFFNGYLQAK